MVEVRVFAVSFQGCNAKSIGYKRHASEEDLVIGARVG